MELCSLGAEGFDSGHFADMGRSGAAPVHGGASWRDRGEVGEKNQDSLGDE
jgi:hypothetical protein